MRDWRLDLDDLLHIAGRILASLQLRDPGFLESAVARPGASAFGKDAYPSLATKAAALLHSIACNRALVDGNKRLALAATLAFLGINGVRITLTDHEAYGLVILVAADQLDPPLDRGRQLVATFP